MDQVDNLYSQKIEIGKKKVRIMVSLYNLTTIPPLRNSVSSRIDSLPVKFEFSTVISKYTFSSKMEDPW